MKQTLCYILLLMLTACGGKEIELKDLKSPIAREWIAHDGLRKLNLSSVQIYGSNKIEIITSYGDKCEFSGSVVGNDSVGYIDIETLESGVSVCENYIDTYYYTIFPV